MSITVVDNNFYLKPEEKCNAAPAQSALPRMASAESRVIDVISHESNAAYTVSYSEGNMRTPIQLQGFVNQLLLSIEGSSKWCLDLKAHPLDRI